MQHEDGQAGRDSDDEQHDNRRTGPAVRGDQYGVVR